MVFRKFKSNIIEKYKISFFLEFDVLGIIVIQSNRLEFVVFLIGILMTSRLLTHVNFSCRQKQLTKAFFWNFAGRKSSRL